MGLCCWDLYLEINRPPLQRFCSGSEMPDHAPLYRRSGKTPRALTRLVVSLDLFLVAVHVDGCSLSTIS